MYWPQRWEYSEEPANTIAATEQHTQVFIMYMLGQYNQHNIHDSYLYVYVFVGAVQSTQYI